MSPFDKLYAAFAVEPSYDGPLASDFHKLVARRYLAGMTGGHTSIGPSATSEGLVREHLALDWALSRGLYRRMNRFDNKFNWRNGNTGKTKSARSACGWRVAAGTSRPILTTRNNGASVAA